MDHSVHNKLISFIWNIADDCLRDVYVRGKYRDVILPMVVLRRLDTLLEPTKEAVLEEVKFQKEEMQATELDDEPLKAASGYVFYNTSKWTLKSLFNTATNNQQILLANFEEYLLGFSDNVKEIIECFNLKSQIRHMASKQVLLDVVEKFVSPYINLTPETVEDPDGNKMPALTNLGMGYVFEELIRKFNEENNEEAGEHFTPREVIELMTHLVFDPVKDQLPLTMTVYDPACGSGGMLTESQNFIEEKYPNDSRDVYLYGKEINDETYAICKSDMMIKGNNPENIKVGSTLSTDEFAASRFDFMLSNPPYGKSWASEQKHIKDGSDVIDPRFKVSLKDYWGNLEVVDATPRSSDGQLLFLMEMVNKMKDPSVSPLGSRIASVHNGSSLFTGDAGGGESNIRRFIIENDMLDAIVQLPNNLFYNTGITTYIWVLNNNKPEARKGKVQLIDASLLYRKLRKNLGNKNCEFAPEHITEITDTYLACVDVERALDVNNDPIGIASKVFSNDDFGYYKVTIERPDRRRAKFTQDAIAPLRFGSGSGDKQLSEVTEHVYAEHGERVYEKTGYGSDKKKSFLKSIEKDILSWCEENDISLNAKAKAKLLDVKHWLALKALLETSQTLMGDIGSSEFDDFNKFKTQVDKSLKAHAIKLSAPEKNAILNAVSWYDETAKKVVKKIVKLTGDKLNDLLERYECEVADLPDFGYYPVPATEGGKKGEFITYETNSDLRDTESVPLKQSIYQYFLDEVKPHVDEAWINLDTVKIGYEISFNKYFYRHKALRSLQEVATDIINLEQKAEGLIAQILGVSLEKVQG
ncbi:class I SAM-dependent DNA methyltransferase [Vibrio parahaemolyticus]|uniref:type I restriction-modification system subunit M n=1 Tax=Vibrio parahaemolyticus TaxID=670 RepID=UPI003261026B|nr:SAM-dependent DNA methyltransferase [Vibrio parahaemolyticus]HCE2048362.1 SAM-dependent DNA methyltransferase [Vibrio parahaemolyticus]HCE2404519.1 SAM-dependent DNA methyltransferase [Vibrio parahaemolyticus]HCE3082847.1 SAM-dependent DNA methyltransferase [Vibrio parahaemolyticus]HCG5227556.1 SAM-dependent DNA methyltransferase [Vibrio parahaemolyticus]